MNDCSSTSGFRHPPSMWDSVECEALPSLPDVDDCFAGLPELGSPTKRPVKKACRGDGAKMEGPLPGEALHETAAEGEDAIWEWASLGSPPLELSLPGGAPALYPGAGFAQPFWAEPLPRPAVAGAPPGSSPLKPWESTRLEEECVLLDPPPGSNLAEVQLVGAGTGRGAAEEDSAEGVMPVMVQESVESLPWSEQGGKGTPEGRMPEASGEEDTAERTPLAKNFSESACSEGGSTGASGTVASSGREAEGALSGPWLAATASAEVDVGEALALVRSAPRPTRDGAANERMEALPGGIVSYRDVSREDARHLAYADWATGPSCSEKRLRDLRELVGGSGVTLPRGVPALTSSTASRRPADLSSRLAEVIRARIKDSPRSPPATLGGRPSRSSATRSVARLPSAEVSVRRIVLMGSTRVNPVVKGKLAYERARAWRANPTADRALGEGRFLTPDPVLRSRLFELAEAIAVDDPDRANFLTSLLKDEATPAGSVLQRVVFYFMSALAARKKGMTAQEYIKPVTLNLATFQALEDITNEVPFLMFHMDVINDAILESIEGEDSVHIIDLTMWSGQWGPLLRCLSERPGGPPFVRITAVDAPPGTPRGSGPTMPAGVLKLEVMMAAAEAGVRVSYHTVVAKLEELQPALLRLQPGEPLAIAACMRLQQLPDATVMRSNPRDTFLKKIRTWDPKILVISGINLEQNTPFFLARVRAAVDFYANLFDSLEGLFGRESVVRQVFEQTIWGREILHTVASEGLDRVQREETVDKWQARMQRCGFLGRPPSAATVQTLRSNVKKFHQNFDVTLHNQALLLAWKEKPIMTGHAWIC